MNIQSFKDHILKQTQTVQKAQERFGFDGLVIYSGRLKYHFNDDTTYDFRINPYFKLWCPLWEQVNSFVIVDGSNLPKILFYAPDDFWHAVAPLPSDEWTKQFEIIPFSNAADIPKLLPSNLENYVFLGEEEDLAKEQGFTKINPQEIYDYFDFHRSYKTDYEQDCIRESTKIAVKGHLAAKDAFYAGDSEFEINLKYQMATGLQSFQLPYSPIIAINKNPSILHYTETLKHRAAEVPRYSFLIDAGANYNGYASDITRTYSYQNDEFSELIKDVEKAQLELNDFLRPGLSYAEAHNESHKKIASILNSWNFLKADVEDILKLDLVKTFYPHGLGHFLGLQTHDKGAFLADDSGTPVKPPKEHPHLRASRIIEENMVYTVEPGLYFIDSLLNKAKNSDCSKLFNWDKIEQFKKFGGIRIEDNLIIKKDKNINLTRDAGLNS